MAPISVRRALLLDFDGVVVRNPKVDRYVSNACVRWLSQKTKQRFVDARQCNRVHYPKLGHTSRVLQHVFRQPCSHHAFNREVYGDGEGDGALLDGGVLARLFTPGDRATLEDLTARVLEPWRQAHGERSVYVFSNAPTAWCTRVLQALGADASLFDGYLCSDTRAALKPTWGAYLHVEMALTEQHPDLERIVFVDDQLGNVDLLYQHPNLSSTTVRWDGVHYPSACGVEALADTLRRHAYA